MSNGIPTGEQNTANLELIANKDASNGYAGLTLLKINFKNALNTFTSFLTNSNTASRTYTFPDRSLTVAGTDEIIPLDGWIPLGTCTYETADSPSFQFSLASDVTGFIRVGHRIKLTQTTTKYFIVHAVGAYSGGKTIITVYGGTDYTLANAAISSPYYSNINMPFGFPVTEDKWTITYSDTTTRSQASPVSGTWYNLGSASISEPIGAWKGKVSCLIGSNRASAGAVSSYATISTANNTESDATRTFGIAFDTGLTSAYCNFEKSFDISAAAKTTLYFNTKVNNAGLSNIFNFNANSTLVIKLTSAYL